jgi:DHA1 family inner membrane transport protein
MAAALMGVGAISGYMGLPYLVGLMADKLALNNQQTGWLASADLTGICIVSLLAPLWLKRVSWRLVIPVALAIVVVMNVLTAFVNDIGSLVAFRVLSGVAGGAVFTQAMVFLATSDRTERNIGIYSACATTWICICMILMPSLAESHGTTTAVLLLAAIPLACSGGLFLWPRDYSPTFQSSSERPHSVWSREVLIGLSCFILFMANIGILWGFVERIGTDYGFEAIPLGQSIALANFVSIAGGLIAAWVGNRFGHFKPLTFALGTQAAIMLLVATGDVGMTLWLFTLLLCSYFLLWNFIDVFQISVLVDFEPSGRAVGLVPAFSAIGSALGPVTATLLMSGEGFRSVPVIAAAMCLATIALYAYLFWAGRMPNTPQ